MPVPAKTSFGLTGLTANEPTSRKGSCWSVRGVQLGSGAVALVVFQTPPPTVPA
jgi:hypothetical protein